MIVAVATACGTYGGEEPATGPATFDAATAEPRDAGPDGPERITDASGPDADAAPSRCNRAAPFDAPAPVEELNTPNTENAAWLTPDERTVYFARGSKLLRATRDDVAAPFSAPEAVPFSNGDNDGDHPSLTPDELTIVVTVGNLLRTSTRPNATTPFPPVATIGELNATMVTEGTANLTNGGREIYFRREVGNNLDLLMASRPAAVGAFGTPQQLVSVNSAPANDTNPVAREDGLELWFASTRGAGVNNNRIHVSTRASKQEPFGAPVLVEELNVAGASNVPAWISPDGCVIWIASNRPGGAGGVDLYRAARPR